MAPHLRVPRRAILRAAALLAVAVLAFVPALALAAVPPHLADSGSASPDACAICHRAHTGTVELSYRTTASIDPTGNALVVAPAPDFGTPGFPAPQPADVGLCFTCHGGGGLGSQYDVETSFTLGSTHGIAPMTSAFGPSPKMCGSCHDPHGTDRVTVGGAPYPKLLRAWEGTTTVLSKEEYCAACHKTRSASRFDGLAVYRKTGHYTGMPDPADGTLIRCSNCHVAHGSDVAPLVVGQVVPPAAPDTITVTANDRRLCLACHPTPTDGWSGETTYALSAHAAAATTVGVIGEWTSAGATRRVGECQVCHAPMGSSDGSGGAIAKLLDKPGRALCDDCHKAGGVAKADLASLAYPSVEATAAELAIVWGPDARSAFAGRTDLYGRETTGTPRGLIGPRAYATPDASGAAAVGDVDRDGSTELVVGDWAAKTITIMHENEMLGLVAAPSQAVSGTPDFIAIGRFVVPTVGSELDGPRPQIAVVDAAAGKLWIYENILLDTLTRIAGPEADGSYALGAAGTGIAAGDFAGGALQDLAVTTRTELLLYTQSGTASQVETIAAVAGTGLRGPSIGDVHATAGLEVVVCDTVTREVLVYAGTGSPVDSYELTETPWASAVGDALTGSAGHEIVVAAHNATGLSNLSVIPQAGPIQDYSIAGSTGSDSGSVLVTDVEGDGIAETLLGDAGLWDAAGMTAPAVRVYRPDDEGTALSLAATLYAGGSQLAGTAPALLTADFGPVLPSRHPVDAVASHVSTETGSFARHVTCSDCHSSHEASSGIAASAPYVTGNMRGAWGVAVTNSAAGTQTHAPSARAVRQYEVCLKCHATTAEGRRDIASLVNTRNVSVHAVEGVSSAPTALPGSYVNGWGNASVLYCSDCHGNSAGSLEAAGTHRSGEAPLLKAPVLGLEVSSTDLLCYRCHKRDVYNADPASAASRFYDGSLGTPSLHARHTGTGMGFACSTCHVSHGSATQPHLLRSDIGYAHELPVAHLGECTNACHGAPRDYPGPP